MERIIDKVRGSKSNFFTAEFSKVDRWGDQDREKGQKPVERTAECLQCPLLTTLLSKSASTIVLVVSRLELER